MKTPGYVITADGTVFEGHSIGVEGISSGELVFNTSMTGYQEILTDPSYAGQIVLMTSPHIGNYGTTGLDSQADRPFGAGLVVRSLARTHSNWRAEGSLADYLQLHGVIAVAGVDTRRLTRHVRSFGSMPAAIGGGVDRAAVRSAAVEAPRLEGRDLVKDVTTSRPYEVPAVGPRRGRIVALDLGIKRDICARLAGHGLDVTVVPAGTSAADIAALHPDALFLSNGPGDPEPLAGPIAAVRATLGTMPVFGICLGHQVLGLALGAATVKLPFGHHGGNHPVRRISDGRVSITAHNHGFSVDLAGLGTPDERGAVESPYGPVEPTYVNLNDRTLEGLRAGEAGAFGVQFHPEAAPGPHDADPLFGEFIRALGS
ncbi:MAG: glutamine-hydrolyzing carbamoyl-phosphate synthase small subunit [Acidimicrobiia bacterium]|nr:glutamine-hydrolyzing carbamoyl-phosphate synthase small subunit [Acidimicrobiia bacterium]